jgi:hypothetical protein
VGHTQSGTRINGAQARHVPATACRCNRVVGAGRHDAVQRASVGGEWDVGQDQLVQLGRALTARHNDRYAIAVSQGCDGKFTSNPCVSHDHQAFSVGTAASCGSTIQTCWLAQCFVDCHKVIGTCDDDGDDPAASASAASW